MGWLFQSVGKVETIGSLPVDRSSTPGGSILKTDKESLHPKLKSKTFSFGSYDVPRLSKMPHGRYSGGSQQLEPLEFFMSSF